MSTLFTSASSQLKSRMETMRSAESDLVKFSHRFGTSSGQARPTMELIDTEIPRSVLPLKDNTNKRRFCPLPELTTKHELEEQEEKLIMHGIKVTSNEQITNDDPSSAESAPLVLLHGYANGALYFYRNLHGLSHHFGTVYSLDMLGWGLSSRPPFETKDSSIETTEEFFVESLEAWRKANDIAKMTLAGHSMGGYLSVAYCERYPHRVDRLILLSPVGVPHKDEEQQKSRGRMPLRYRLMFGLASTLFDNGTTPGSFLRSLPSGRSRKLVEGYVEHRLPAVASVQDERTALTDYLYTNFMLPGSGEYALNRLLSVTAHAKKPTVQRIPKLDVKSVSFIYGQNDWMDVTGGLQVQQLCEEMKQVGMDVPDVDVHGVRDAGHLLMLENWEEFNSVVIRSGGGRPARVQRR